MAADGMLVVHGTLDLHAAGVGSLGVPASHTEGEMDEGIEVLWRTRLGPLSSTK